MSDIRTTVQVYYDEQDPHNVGWAWSTDGHGSGPLEGHENERTLDTCEALAMARQALEESGCTRAVVFAKGEGGSRLVYDDQDETWRWEQR